MPAPLPLHWDLFCRVVDNFGDIGVSWRLANDLAARGQRVRLWADDPAALEWMAPGGRAGVHVERWVEPFPGVAPADVVIEAFGCALPPAFVEHMAARAAPPVWINLEYLSAEDYVPRCHGLPSPVLAGPGRGLCKWFFYPGFCAGSGGLLREAGLMARREGFDGRAWLAAQGWSAAAGERVVSLFCYDTAPLPQLMGWLTQAPTLLLLTPGAAQRGARHWLAAHPQPTSLRCLDLPWLPQADYDRLLWACDLNFVRGEDSFVLAMWAAAPFVWQIYPQHDAAHAVKLEAFLARFLAGADGRDAAPVRALWRAWNGLQPWPAEAPMPDAWGGLARRWRAQLLQQVDLCSQLLEFVHERR